MSVQYHLRVHKTLERNLKFRRSVLLQAAGHTSAQRALMDACRTDPIFWVNLFVWQYNPNAIGDGSLDVGPFVTWDFQDRAVEKIRQCIADRRDLVIEKSREMGASWLCLLVILHSLLFEPWKKYLVISRNEHAVDKPGDPDSLFWKLDFVLARLPDWMTAGVTRRKLVFENTANGSTITGQASTGKAGVGGRCTAMFVDEFSQIEEDYEVYQRTSDTTGCRIFNGTHKGQGAFFELTDPTTLAGSTIQKLQMHWTEHPDKRRGLYRFNPDRNAVEVIDKTYDFPPDFDFVRAEEPTGGPFPGLRSPWYDAQCKRKGHSRAVAMDLDIAPAESSAQFFNALTIRQLRRSVACPPLWVGDLEYDKETCRPIRLYPCEGGQIHLWLRPDAQGLVPPDRYGGGADLSTGSGASNSALSIGSARTGQKVLELATAHTPPEILAKIYAALGWLFKDETGQPALLSWEHKGPGLIFGRRLVGAGYGRVYRTQKVGRDHRRMNEAGWIPTPDTKRVLLEEYRDALMTRAFTNYSDKALEETLAYHYSDRRDAVEHPKDQGGEDPTGARTNHGDRVIADALCWRAMVTLGVEIRVEKAQAGPPVNSLAWRRDLRSAQSAAERAWI